MTPTMTADARTDLIAGAATDMERETLDRSLPPAATIKLMSIYGAFRCKLESPEEVIDSHHGKYTVPGTGYMLVFANHRAELPAERWEQLFNHRDQPVQRGWCGREDEWTGRAPVTSGPRITHGAITANVQRENQLPYVGWDQATGRQAIEWIQAGKVPDLAHAEAYEYAHQGRKMVIRALMEARIATLGGPPEEPEEIAPSASATVPGNAGGDL